MAGQNLHLQLERGKALLSVRVRSAAQAVENSRQSRLQEFQEKPVFRHLLFGPGEEAGESSQSEISNCQEHKIFQIKVDRELNFETKNMFPFVDSSRKISHSRSLMQSQTEFKKIFSKRLESAYANTMNKLPNHEVAGSNQEIGSNVYCINNRDLSNASKVRLIKKIEKTDIFADASKLEVNREGGSSKNHFDSNAPSRNTKLEIGSKTDFSITNRGKTNSTISFLKGFERQYNKLNSSKQNV